MKNVQGDVVQIRSSYGTLLVEYTYDAWGNVLSITGSNASVLGANNPIRYRSYYYDFETGFYYLQSRYYDPAMRRFINADGYASTGIGFIGFNMYSYCTNNPVDYVDANGELAYPGEIHQQVVNYISTKYGFYKEQTIVYNIGWGRADLISPDGQVWEVKPQNSAITHLGSIKPVVKKQINKYVANTWKNNPSVELSVGGYIPSESFIYKNGLFTYRVTYQYFGNGVICYTYEDCTNWEPVEEVASDVAAFIALMLSMIGMYYGISPQGTPAFQ